MYIGITGPKIKKLQIHYNAKILSLVILILYKFIKWSMNVYYYSFNDYLFSSYCPLFPLPQYLDIWRKNDYFIYIEKRFSL